MSSRGATGTRTPRAGAGASASKAHETPAEARTREAAAWAHAQDLIASGNATGNRMATLPERNKAIADAANLTWARELADARANNALPGGAARNRTYAAQVARVQTAQAKVDRISAQYAKHIGMDTKARADYFKARSAEEAYRVRGQGTAKQAAAAQKAIDAYNAKQNNLGERLGIAEKGLDDAQQKAQSIAGSWGLSALKSGNSLEYYNPATRSNMIATPLAPMEGRGGVTHVGMVMRSAGQLASYTPSDVRNLGYLTQGHRNYQSTGDLGHQNITYGGLPNFEAMLRSNGYYPTGKNFASEADAAAFYRAGAKSAARAAAKAAKAGTA